jgi:hypothetical protein
MKLAQADAGLACPGEFDWHDFILLWLACGFHCRLDAVHAHL